MHVHTHACTYTHVYHTHTHTHIDVHAQTHVTILAHMCMYTQMYSIHTCTHIDAPTQRYAHQTHLRIIVASNHANIQLGVHDALMTTFQGILNINIWA